MKAFQINRKLIIGSQISYTRTLILFILCTTRAFQFSAQAQYCASGATNINDSEIDQVVLNGNTTNINNNTASICATYSNFTALPAADLTIGSTYTVSVTVGTCSAFNTNKNGAVYIDWNGDLDFVDAGESLGTFGSGLNTTFNVNFTVPASASTGNTRMRIIVKEDLEGSVSSPCEIFTFGETEDYTVNIQAATPMSFVSSTTTQNNTSGVLFNASNAEVLGIEIVTSGASSPLNATQFQINMTGTTSISDVTTIHIYYTGTSATFATTNEFVSGGTTPAAGTITINGSQTLASGTNYFWIAYDLNGIAGNRIDAETTSLTVGGIARTPTVTAPVGDRILFSGPGGIGSNLALWLKANAGTNSTAEGAGISQWADQSGNANNAVEGTASQQPLYRISSMNFNPSLDFDGANDKIGGPAGGYSLSYFVVFSPDVAISSSTGGGTVFAYESPASVSNFAALGVGPNTASFTNEVIVHLVGGQTEWRSAQVGAATYAANKPLLINVTDNSAGTSTEIYADGLRIDNATNATFLSVTANTIYNVGTDNPSTPFVPLFFDGQISEVITFSSRVSTTNRQQIISYLALKYGLTLDQSTALNYVASDGNTVFPATTTHSAYNNDIAGIGLDGAACLNQKQSLSENSDAIVTIGLGSIASSNAANSNNFSADLSFLIWGNDNAALTATGTIVNADNVTTSNRLERVWRVAETGTVGDIEVSIPASTAGGVLQSIVIHPSDNTFPNDANRRVFDLASDGGGNLTATVDLVDGEYFTFAEQTAAVLPIELLYFRAEPSGNQVKLTWATATEINNDFFTVERTKDLAEWEVVLKTQGAGNSSQTLDYQAIDETPYQGVSYYRLKQTDFDGQFAYSELVRVLVTAATSIELFPNPADENFTITAGFSLRPDQIEVLDNTGRILDLPMQERSANKIIIDTEKLAPSVYHLRFLTDEGITYKKIIVE